MDITQDGPFCLVERERFVARFPADATDDLEQLQDQDFYVTVTGGLTYYASLMPFGAIDAVLRRGYTTSAARRLPHNCHYGVAAFCPFSDYRIAGISNPVIRTASVVLPS